jgi:hypothetical protein
MNIAYCTPAPVVVIMVLMICVCERSITPYFVADNVLLTRPVLLLPLLPVVWFTWWVGRQYLHVSRELKRLESLKKSPVFVLFSETLQVGCL